VLPGLARQDPAYGLRDGGKGEPAEFGKNHNAKHQMIDWKPHQAWGCPAGLYLNRTSAVTSQQRQVRVHFDVS